MHESVLIEDLAVILCVAGIVAILFQKIKQPTVLGYLIAGIIVGPYTPPFSFIEDTPDIETLAQFGVIFLMFSLGLEFSFQKLKKIGFPAIIIGVIEVILMIAIGYLAGKLLGWSSSDSFLLGFALSISSTTIIIKALEELNLKKHFFADLMVGVLLIEDLLAIILMVFISTTTETASFFSSQIFFASIELMLVVSSWFLVGYFIMPFLMKRIQSYINHETLTILATGLCFFLSAVAIYFHYSAALGAFIMGSILAETTQAHKIEVLTYPIRDMFAAVFFVSVGMLINPIEIWNFFPYIVILSIVTIVGKIFASGLGALVSGQTLSTSLRIGFGMAQIGEFSFIIIGLGGIASSEDNSLYSIIVAIAAITTFATPYLMKFSIKFSQQLEDAIPKRLHNLMEDYRKWIHSIEEQAEHKKSKSTNMVRFIINGMIVATICSVSSEFLVPKLQPISDIWPMQLMIWAITLIISSPFIWAMLFANQAEEKAEISFPLILSWAITIAILSYFVVYHLSYPIDIALIIFAFVAYFILNNKHIKNMYWILENQLITGLTKK